MKPRCSRPLASFTLIELLTVIAIIAILAGLVLSAYNGVMKSAARSRARTEIAAISAALESYQADNGSYPFSYSPPGFQDTNSYVPAIPNLSGASYELSSAFLYENLTGQTNYGDVPPSASNGSSMKIYMTFKSSQLGNYSSGAGNIYLKDPFGNSYGYFSGSSSGVPVNGTNQFDFWSTGGDVSGTSSGMNSWISNWGLGS